VQFDTSTNWKATQPAAKNRVSFRELRSQKQAASRIAASYFRNRQLVGVVFFAEDQLEGELMQRNATETDGQSLAR
jgi:hypothetical protein